MKSFLWKVKGYLAHGALVGVVLFDPAAKALIAAHPSYAAVAGLVWGGILHFAQGKLSPPAQTK